MRVLSVQGRNKLRSFVPGVLSGAVEPVFGALTVAIAALVVPAMPVLLSFAAGAMLYVVETAFLCRKNARRIAQRAGIWYIHVQRGVGE